MSIVAISETAGSSALEIGRTLASTLGYAFADREIRDTYMRACPARNVNPPRI